MDANTLADLGVNPHPGYADQTRGIETPSEAIAAALDLVEHLRRLAALEPHARTNAVPLLMHHSEAGDITEKLSAFLIGFETPA
jgi:hypothetical protein